MVVIECLIFVRVLLLYLSLFICTFTNDYWYAELYYEKNHVKQSSLQLPCLTVSGKYKYCTVNVIHYVHLYLKSKDPSLTTRTAPKPRVNDGLKMRASVRMTRYLESWGAVKPFAHLQNREGFTPDTIVNGKPRSRVSRYWSSCLFASLLDVIKKTYNTVHDSLNKVIQEAN